MNSRRFTLPVLCCVVVFAMVRAGSARPSADQKSAFAAADARILAEIHDHSEAMANLEYLSDNIGSRLTGSPQLKRANEWTRDILAKYGLANAHLEGWTIARSWTRGAASARIVSPTEHLLTIAAAGWSPGTQGTIKGPVVYFDAKKKEEFGKFHGKLKGAIVIYQEPSSLSPPKADDPHAQVSRPMQQPPPRLGEAPLPDPFEAFQQAAKERTEFFKQEGVVAVLRDSNKPHGLLNMTDVSLKRYGIGPIPTAFITGEGYRMLFRMLRQGPVQVEMAMSNAFSDKPVEVYNTIAEIRGSEKPDEMVILGAHLDSWDLGTGSTDNGTGSIAVLEAARAIAKLKLKPRRTIRFVLFSGEEQGLYGSQEYVKAHQKELEKVSGVLVHDEGTGRVLTLGLHDNYQDRELVDQVLSPLGELKLLEPRMARSSGTDHLSFDQVGVPGFFCIQDRAEYNLTHHSQSDTFDKVWKDELNQGAAVLAAWAYNTAELPTLLPRRPLPYNPGPSNPSKDAQKDPPSDPPNDALADMDEKILQQVKADEPILKSNLTYLTEQIGARLTGSPNMEKASRWTAEQFKAAGLSNVNLEAWTIANSWTRGPASGRLVAPGEEVLTLATAGWSPSTNGAVRGSVVRVVFEKPQDLEQYKGKLKGAIVLFGRPREMQAPEFPLATPWADGTIPVARPKGDARPIDPAAYRQARLAAMKMFADERAIAVLVASEKQYGLLNMTAFSREYQPALLPIAFATRESYEQMWRLLDDGASLEAEVNIQGSFSGKPVEVYNTVAEIPGTEKPHEVVIIGAHLDSWDLGTGATDNGTGSMAVLTAARALQKVGVKPKRTIRFVLFSGEEQGLNGSRAYVKAHKEELGKISGVLVHDSGTGKVLTVGLMGNYGAREAIDRVLYPLATVKEIGLTEPSLRSEGGSDHVPFDEAGVPGFWCVQDNADYDKTHHSQADTLDRVLWDDLTEGAQVLAVFAYNVAQAAEMLPRKPAKQKQSD